MTKVTMLEFVFCRPYCQNVATATATTAAATAAASNAAVAAEERTAALGEALGGE
jgi:hypothetical protein